MENIEQRYKEVTEWMFSQVPMFHNLGAGAYKPGLERVEALSKAFGSPHKAFKSIHVAGTNGKGSTSSLLASILTEHGQRKSKIGLFTSPHLLDFRERIRINGEMISEADVVNFIDRFKQLGLAELEPSFFELTTVMAFDWFARMGVDTAVIEVGLGGRLDSTNIINPVLSIITNISLDHTSLLGDTIEKIAYEKAGIIKPDTRVIIGHCDEKVRRVFEDKAAREHAPIVFAQDQPAFMDVEYHPDSNVYINTHWRNIESPLTGECQAENANTVFTALSFLPTVCCSPDDVRLGFANVFRNTGLMGRWMIMGTSPTIVCDTGHNPGGWEFLGPRLCEISKNGPLRMVIGFVNDKDINTILSMMPRNAEYYFTAPDVKRARSAASLQEEAARHGLHGAIYPTVGDAFKAAMDGIPQDGTIFVGGSTFIVADYLKFYRIK